MSDPVVIFNVPLDGRSFSGFDACRKSFQHYAPERSLLFIEQVQDINSSLLQDFLAVYKPQHSQTNVAELFNFARWFYLLELMRQRGLPSVWHFDSDILLVGSLDDRLQGYSGGGGQLHLSITSIEQICRYLILLYTADARLRSEYITRWSGWDVHTDMSVLQSGRFQVELPESFDGNLCITEGWASRDGHKRLWLVDGRVCAVRNDPTRIVYMTTLHCWGPFKTRMEGIWGQITGQPGYFSELDL